MRFHEKKNSVLKDYELFFNLERPNDIAQNIHLRGWNYSSVRPSIILAIHSRCISNKSSYFMPQYGLRNISWFLQVENHHCVDSQESNFSQSHKPNCSNDLLLRTSATMKHNYSIMHPTSVKEKSMPSYSKHK
jgi:hypothetical protein